MTIPQSSEAKSFGALVRGHRRRSGLTQQELADFSTISVRAIRNIEKGRVLNPRKHTVNLIADGLRLGAADRMRLQAAANRNGGADALRVDFLASPPPPRTLRGGISGREREAAALESALSGEVGRLVTVTGLPGVGKTCLAMAVTENLHSAGGAPVLWVDCAPSTGARTASGGKLADLARAAGEELTSSGGRPGTGEGAVAALADLVGERRAIVVLDGVGPSALDLGRTQWLFARCPELLLLVTSTAAQGADGERLLLLGPLALPAAGDRIPQHAPAVSLFLRRVRMLRPDLTDCHGDMDALVRVCRSLDGLPGALEAAASWLSVYEPSDLAAMVAKDPLTPLTPLSSGPVPSSLGSRLMEAVRMLGDRERDLLLWMCETGEPVEIDRIAQAWELSLTDCGRLLHTLIAGGLVRRPDYGEGLVVLRLVRALVGGLSDDAVRTDDVFGTVVC
ncbi:hypothetical protein SUDANB121_05586 [Nocardiopsis dassonvillei]|uniref:helix-turn-helix domain-containing protein n=1 Tax=Nocardiopsis dassonvillei TaxID=2014 RepID=UPI003F572BA0